MQHKALTEKILASCFAVAKDLGPGFLESVYHGALMIALAENGLRAASQVGFVVSFRGKTVGSFCADVMVEDVVILEIKAVKSLLNEHFAQLLNYLKASRVPIGLLVNFGSTRLDYRRFDNRWISQTSENETDPLRQPTTNGDGEDGRDA